MWQFTDLQFADPYMFFLLNIRKYIIFLFTNFKMPSFKFKEDFFAFGTVLRQSYKRIWIRNTVFFFAKFADLRLADRDTKEIFGFAICRLIITKLRICNMRTGTPQKLRIAITA